MRAPPWSVPVVEVRRQAVTVKEALRLPALRVGVPEVIAGRKNLGRPIRWVHAGEFTEMASVLKGGELLLTTGMGVPKEDRAARQWIADLDTCGIAGIVIELGSALVTIPRAILLEARERALPMIALHQQVAFVEVTEVLHREILGHGAALLTRGRETDDRLSELLLTGARTAEVIEAVAELVGEPVVLARADGRILFQANHGRAGVDVASTWEHVRRGLDDGPRAGALPVRLGGDAHWAELAALPFEGELADLESAALEHAVPFVAFALMRDREASALAARGRAEFLVTLVNAELSELQARTKAEALGFDHRAGSLLPIVVTHHGAGAAPTDDQWVRLAERASERLRSGGRSAIGGVQAAADGILLVVRLRDCQERATVAEEVAEAVHAAAAKPSFAGGLVHVSVGRAAESWREAGLSLRDAIASAQASVYRDTRPWHDVSCPDIAELLWLFRTSPALGRLVQQRIQPLVEHDQRHNSALLHTLEVLFEHGGRKAEAARALYLERQSLYKRIARIEALLDVDLDDEDTRLALQLALRARPLLTLAESP